MTSSRTFSIWATLLTTCGVAVLCGLGNWQLERLEWKKDLLARIEAQKNVPPQALGRDDLTIEHEFKSGTLRGRFAFEKEITLVPRTHKGKPGAHILTPYITNSGTAILINRGWIADGEEPTQKQQDQVTGMIRTPPAANMFTPQNDPENNIWYSADLTQVAQINDLPELAPVMLYQACDDDLSAPDPCALELHIKNDHLQYAFFWFAMAFTLVVIYVLRFLRGRP